MRKDKTLLWMMGICLVLFVSGTFFDEPVEWFMAEHGLDVISVVAAAIGPVPPYVMLAVCFAYLSIAQRYYGIISLVFSFIAGWSLFHLFVDGIVLIALVVVTGILLYFFVRWSTGKMESSEVNRKRIIAVISVIVIARIVVEVMKVIFARPRFIYLDELDASFSPWYVMHQTALLDDCCKSFPSGHAMSASLLYLWTYFGKGKKWKTAVAIGFAIFVSIGRMMCGMHYLSDVAMGMFIGYGVVYLFGNMLEYRS